MYLGWLIPVALVIIFLLVKFVRWADEDRAENIYCVGIVKSKQKGKVYVDYNTEINIEVPCDNVKYNNLKIGDRLGYIRYEGKFSGVTYKIEAA